MTDDTLLDLALMIGPTLVIVVVVLILYKLKGKKGPAERTTKVEPPEELTDEESAEEPVEEPPELKGVPPASDEDVLELVTEMEKTSHKVLSEKVGKGGKPPS
jgi:hypothetical protein